MAWLFRVFRTRRTPRSLAILALLCFLLALTLRVSLSAHQGQQNLSEKQHADWDSSSLDMDKTLSQWIHTPLSGSFEAQSTEMGRRIEILRKWIQLGDEQIPASRGASQSKIFEKAMADLFPFLSGESRGKPYTNLFDKLKTSYDATSCGIVIPTSVDNLRQTFHLVGALREVLHSTLPIQIVYAGNDGLRSFQREMLAHRFTDIRFLDIYTVFREPSSQLDVSLSSLRTSACVATTFKDFILLSGDLVLLRKPEELFDLPTHRRTGALIYNDRVSSSGPLNTYTLHDSSGFQPDANAKVSQIHDLSVAVLDKSRHSVLFAMLHASWQCHLKEQAQTDHTAVNRESETWRLGFEHTSAPYELQTPTDALVGWPRFEAGEEICKFAHGFSGLNGRILWYSQPMPIVESPADQDIPTHRVAAVSGQHELSNNDIICAVRNEAQRLRSQEKQVIKEIIYKAQELDEEFKLAKMHRSLTSSNGEVYR